MHLAGMVLLLASFVGSALLGWAVVLAGRLGTRRAPIPWRAVPVTLLKPLHGLEPRLAENVASFFAWDGPPVQMVCGVQAIDDPARGLAEGIAIRPGDSITVVVSGGMRARNPKIANLIGMLPAATHDILVLSDSDIAVAPGYLDRIVAALDEPGVGAVTCLYRGRGDAGFWSRLGAMGIDLHFLPSVLIGIATRMATPCMGSTIALRRETLDRIGGFGGFADDLADDYAIGAAVRALGLRVVVPDMLVTHGCSEPDLAALVRHELRWNATVAALDPSGYAGSVVLHPLPLALIGGALLGLPWVAWSAVALAILVRAAMGWRLRAIAPMPAASPALIPLRDLLCFALFVAGFFIRSVDWRGAAIKMEGGRIAADTESPI